MDDESIVQLYWDRSEQAIRESSDKYGNYCRQISRNIVENWEDAEECVNDTWLRAWNVMPPQRPSVLSIFFGRITRNLSFDLYRREHRKKRGGHSIELVLDELAECVSGNDDPEKSFQKTALAEEINRFLSGLSKEKRCLFIRRYWYADRISEISNRFGISENNVSVALNRIRKQLKAHLKEKGYDI